MLLYLGNSIPVLCRNTNVVVGMLLKSFVTHNFTICLCVKLEFLGDIIQAGIKEREYQIIVNTKASVCFFIRDQKAYRMTWEKKKIYKWRQGLSSTVTH